MSAYVDILFFALIAAGLVWRLTRVLGQRSDDDVPRAGTPYSAATTKANIEAALASLPPAEAAQVNAAFAANWSTGLPNYDIVETATAHHRLLPFLAVDPSFYPGDFITKARKVFPTIVGAFAKGDVKTLEFLTSPGLFKLFATEIERRRDKNETYTVDVKEVKKAIIVDADLDGTTATITVDFTALQAVTHRTAEGRTIGQEDGQVDTTKDRWVFSKDLKSTDPKWILVKTQEIN